MRPGCTKVETQGSYWWLDDNAGEYLRLPKNEQPRERADWSDERAGLLQDGVWHPMEQWWIDENRMALRIRVPGSAKKVYAPGAEIVGVS